MARLQSYPVDGTIDDLDIVIGSDGAVGENYATKNYTVGGLKTHITTGFATEAYADQAEADAVTTANAYTDAEIVVLLKQTILGSTDQIEVGVDVPPGEVATVTFKPVTGDASTGSLNFNASNNTISIEEALGEITNTSITDITLRISMTAFSSISQNNATVDYILQYYNGVSWNDLKLVERVKSSPGSYADSFWSYFKLPPAHKFRIGFRADREGVILNEFSQIEFEVK
jgi:hypothetical protein